MDWVGSKRVQIGRPNRKELAEMDENVFFFSLIQRRNVLDFSNKKHACYDIHEKQQEKFEDD